MLWSCDVSSITGCASHSYRVVSDFGAHEEPKGAGRKLPPMEGRLVVKRYLDACRDGTAVLRLYHGLLRGQLRTCDVAYVDRMRDELLAAVERGRLLVYKEPELKAGALRNAETEALIDNVVSEKKTWVAIELTDDDEPPKPVPFKRYRIKLPDGTKREGVLDQNGRARVEGVDPGDCEITFPDFDGPDTKRL